jgi:hypothetical protein
MNGRPGNTISAVRAGFAISALAGGVLVSLLLLSHSSADVSPSASAASTNGSLSKASPAPAPAKSPVDVFRELLAVTPEERPGLLAGRSVEDQKRILAKVGEYEALSPSEREVRLHVTELFWYLWPLMNSPATNRSAQLAHVPPQVRKLVSDRLEAWDKLPIKLQRELLENEATIRYYTEIQRSSAREKETFLRTLSGERRHRLEEGLDKWAAMPQEKQQKMLTRFYQFFELTPGEKQKSLATLSEPERRQLENTLTQYSQLTPEQRADCIRSFQKFANMDLLQRELFLKNAERWKLMSPEERQEWKELVVNLSSQPPMPPGLDLPPMPPGYDSAPMPP